MKKKVFNVILVILTIGMIYEVYSYFSTNPNTKVLEDIKTVDVFNNKDKTLSIKVQSGGEGDFEWYEAKDRSKWPDYKQYTYVGTKCEDANGANIENTKQYLTFNEDRNTATITTKKTIYCTLYFGKGRPALEVLNEQGGQYYGGGNKGNRQAVEGLYRFKGNYDQVTNNFVCIGGSLNPEKCGTENNNEYLYRIIGVTDGTEAADNSLGLERGMLKVIKVIPSSTSQAWASDYYNNIDWDHADNTVRTTLNGTFYNGLEDEIKKIIPTVYWWKEDNVTSSTTNQYKIGLMYKNDYINAYKDGTTDNWLHITHTMSGKTETYGNATEWTMTRSSSAMSGWGWTAWYVLPIGYSNNVNSVNKPFAIRPVFYLASNVGLVGNGIESNPYVITSLSNA